MSWFWIIQLNEEWFFWTEGWLGRGRGLRDALASSGNTPFHVEPLCGQFTLVLHQATTDLDVTLACMGHLHRHRLVSHMGSMNEA